VSVAHALQWLAARGCVYPRAQLRGDSREVGHGDVFVAVPGRARDGRDFIDAALARGAAAVLAEARGAGGRRESAPVLWLDGLSDALGDLAAGFYGRPSERLLAVAVTGTNGKTSCSHWVAQMLTAAGTRCAVIGTVGIGFPDERLAPNPLTTPDAISLQRQVRELADAGARALAMEASSIGLDQRRLDGMAFRVALFTNLTRDHLDYHGTLQRYEEAKARLFDWPTLTHAVINLDDDAGRRFAQRVGARPQVELVGYTIAGAARAGRGRHLQAHDVRATADGLRFVADDGAERHALELPLLGRFNAANVLGAIGAALACGLPFAQACALAPRLVPPPGRMQRLGAAGEPLAVIDYAHTPDALASALAALRPVAQARGGALWVVFGAGGERDPGKRAPMGAAAAAADRIVITSDNPRNEDPAAIVAAIAAGVPPNSRVERIADRASAIEFALAQAAASDVVLIAGKGHEDYQEVAGVKRPFADLECARAALARRKAAAC
jgi:UDP-N-acetylmuramoyl-L-alanyl-D-glutamate--2,6-diaminopimelate ligase